MECKFIEFLSVGKTLIISIEEDVFKQQYRDALSETKSIKGVAYVFKARKPVPRLKGESEVLYIGMTNDNVYNRYSVNEDVKSYFDRYRYIINEYGHITIDVYKTSNPEITENNFLYQYRNKHLELPPLNLKSYREALLNE